jgi:hypothetical protein
MVRPWDLWPHRERLLTRHRVYRQAGARPRRRSAIVRIGRLCAREKLRSIA